MATPDTTLTILSGERFSRTGDMPEFRRLLDLRVVGLGVPAAGIHAAFWHRGVKVAEFNDWSDGVDQIVCQGSLNTVQLEEVFAGRAPSAVVPIELRIHESSTNLLASGLVPCRNNPPEGFDPPEDLGLSADAYMMKADYDANDDDVIDESALPPAHSGGNAVIARDRWTLTAANVANKWLPLTYTPDLRLLQLVIEDGAAPAYVTDFTATVSPARIGWSGLGLDGLLAEGDTLVLEYTYTPAGS